MTPIMLSFLPFILALLLLSRLDVDAFAPHSGLKTNSRIQVSFDDFSPGGVETEVAVNEEQQGKGKPCVVGDVLSVRYKGRLLSDGTEFDAGDITFTLGEGRVIPGWEQGLVGAKLSEKRCLRVPPNLAYGAKGVQGVIPPNADLEFDVEIVSIATGNIEKTIARLSSLMDVYKRKGSLS